MGLSRDEVKKIAHLARLAIQESDIAVFERNLSNILDLAENLNQAMTSDTTPMAHPLEGQTQPLRKDEITQIPNREIFQKIAPQVEAGLYLVPQVIEE